ncbi:hypothetical protein NQ315_015809, partial [Exocentrus adspersus]
GMTEEMKELAAALHKTCVAETGIDEGLISKVNAEKVLPDDEKLKCFLKCLMEQTGVLNEDGTLDVDAAIAIHPDEVRGTLEPIIRKCAPTAPGNPCENSWMAHKCLLESNPD